MHDDKPMTDDERELNRCHCFLTEAVRTTGIVLGAGDIARLAMGFRNAMHVDGAMILWEPRTDDVARSR